MSTLIGDGEVRCVAPAAPAASYAVRVSLNGGAEWHANASHGSRFRAHAASNKGWAVWFTSWDVRPKWMYSLPIGGNFRASHCSFR